ncbi:hypothetical protein OG429_03000 [Streptomyces sp. NBC_00190]|uniref:hypothetical protein n=1 Tax=unclassified Streptomyces TaxID=2593676 RepID=UPI002E2CEB00|nr:hypothetical protein [Streptomyces sp. NBC_00190]WSZ38378.1 hypothetical protein OG239_06010 [Streptomyces sp. NBC_00868]
MLLASSLGGYFHWELLLAAVFGFVGSCAFLGALFLGFLGEQTATRIRAGFEKLDLRPKGEPATTRLSPSKICSFMLLGAALAVIFQFPYGTQFAYLQALIVGVAWPTLIGQIMRQAESEKILGLADQVQNPAGSSTSSPAGQPAANGPR